MTKTEIQTIRNVIRRLNEPNCGCVLPMDADAAGMVKLLNGAMSAGQDRQCVSRLYLDTWVVGALECLLPESHDPKLAKRLSS
jgi:hypothetical protein